MRMTFAALTALLACAAVPLVGPPASAQAPAGSPSAAPHAAQQPAAPSRATSAATRTSPSVRPAPVYRVELVVFRATKALGGPEDWAAEAGGAPAASTDVDPGASTGPARPAVAVAGSGPASDVLRLLPASDFQLDGVASRLRASGRYVPVAHIGWAQTASPWGRPVEIPLQSVGLDAQGLTGTVALELGQFLHLALDLRYTMSDPPAGLNAPPGTVFVLDQSHRVRLRERNYFDHPAFGVIAIVTPDEPRRKAGP